METMMRTLTKKQTATLCRLCREGMLFEVQDWIAAVRKSDERWVMVGATGFEPAAFPMKHREALRLPRLPAANESGRLALV